MLSKLKAIIGYPAGPIKNPLQKCFLVFFMCCYSFSFAQLVTIKGKVQAEETALKAATVCVENTFVLTNSNGEFSIPLRPGTYNLVISHAGYKRFEQEIRLATNTAVHTFQVKMIREVQLGEVVVTGLRSLTQRTNINTPVPVDVIGTKKLIQTGQTGLIQMLNYTVPSFHTSRQLLNEPVTLRGLDPHHVLILVNGIRYHNKATLNMGTIRGELGRGSVSNDLNAIPFSAIEKIEILRDGASAQYGSDAIAGVINIRLKESTGKTSINLHTGQYYDKDGEKISFGINQGIALHKKGFLNLSGDLRYNAPTFRGGNYEGTVYYNFPQNATQIQRDSITVADNQKIIDRGFDRKKAVSNVGTTSLTSCGVLVNSGYPVHKSVELFWTTFVNYRSILYNGAYRFPKENRTVNTVLFPDGFKVKIHTDNWDFSTLACLKGVTKNTWHWNFSSTYGSNVTAINTSNTNNASQFALGNNAPTKFYTGTNIFRQLSNNINFTKSLVKKTGSLQSFNLSFGGEWRIEKYLRKQGDEASWKNYDSTGSTQGTSQGFGGIHPDNAGNEGRNVTSTYIDIEMEPDNHLLFQLAGRYEYYSDFGGNLAGKLAARYKFSDKFSLRGSVGNGFHAPGLQQQYFGTIQTVWSKVGVVLTPAIRGIFPNNHKVTQAFGISPLKAEKTLHLGGGLLTTLSPHLNITFDAYWIQIHNRVVLSGIFDKKNPSVAQILIGYPDIDQVQFFTNAINTRTKGADLIVTGNWKIQKTILELSLAANFTHTIIFGLIKTTPKLQADTLNSNTLFNVEERTKLEKGQPNDKIILTLTCRKGKWGLMINNTRFGKTASNTINIINGKEMVFYEFFLPKILTDISLRYSPKTWMTITAGANNVFNIYPDRLKNYINTNQGINIYSNEASQFGYNGGYYFVNMAFNF